MHKLLSYICDELDDADSGEMSYRRGRDSMGRYTSRDENHDLLAKLKDMVKQAETNY